MPRQPTSSESHIENITACLTLALPLLNELNDAFGPPFVQSISNTIQALINLVKLMDKIHQVLWAIINLYVKSETGGSLSPSMLDHIGSFTETLHTIYNFIEAKQEGSKIKQLFQNNEMNKLLKDSHARLDQVMEVLKLEAGAETSNNIREFKTKADLMHRELIELVEALSDTGTLSEKSSLRNCSIVPNFVHCTVKHAQAETQPSHKWSMRGSLQAEQEFNQTALILDGDATPHKSKC
ncbi:hypothetical protein K438DRAFT_1773689 [Mycena galopus ATCC 62051]|nr:hypothetical protein K438DRAFT_1773689 [Mycena galopus ATCC 62051]